MTSAPESVHNSAFLFSKRGVSIRFNALNIDLRRSLALVSVSYTIKRNNKIDLCRASFYTIRRSPTASDQNDRTYARRAIICSPGLRWWHDLGFQLRPVFLELLLELDRLGCGHELESPELPLDVRYARLDVAR